MLLHVHCSQTYVRQYGPLQIELSGLSYLGAACAASLMQIWSTSGHAFLMPVDNDTVDNSRPFEAVTECAKAGLSHEKVGRCHFCG